jgi:fibronectin-binding autotransporter adhesin
MRGASQGARAAGAQGTATGGAGTAAGVRGHGAGRGGHRDTGRGRAGPPGRVEPLGAWGWARGTPGHGAAGAPGCGAHGARDGAVEGAWGRRKGKGWEREGEGRGAHLGDPNTAIIVTKT